MSGTVSVPNTFGAATSGTTPQLDANFTALTAAFNNPLTYAIYAVDSGSANAYVITLSPPPANQAALLGVAIAFKANTSNTAASTLNVNSLGAQAIVRPGGAPGQGGDIVGTVIVVWDGTNYVLQTARASGTPNDYISGFKLTNNGTTGWDIASGLATDSTNAFTISGAALANKSQSAWAAGAAAGGKLSAAAMANNTWYYWYAIRKDSDASVDYGFDVSSTTPTMPSGYTFFRYIGARKTQLAATNWDTFIQHGDEVRWSTPPALDVNGASASTANRTLTTVNTPARKVEWMGHVVQNNPGVTTTGFILTDPDCADVAPGITVSPLSSVGLTIVTATATWRSSVQARCWANTSSQIGVRGTTPDLIYIQTLGWIDPRGRPV